MPSEFLKLNPIKDPELVEKLLGMNKRNLTSIEQQQRYVLEMHRHPMPCPVCLHKVNLYDAADGTKIVGALYRGKYTCPSCSVELAEVVPFVMQPGTTGWHWARKGPPTEEELKKLRELHTG